MQQIDELRAVKDALYQALARGDLARGIKLTAWLERHDLVNSARWAVRLGDLHRRMGNRALAAETYGRAAFHLSEAGLSRQAEAMRRTKRATLPPAAAV